MRLLPLTASRVLPHSGGKVKMEMTFIHLLIALFLALFWTGVFFLLASMNIVPVWVIPWVFGISLVLSIFNFCLCVISSRRNNLP